MRLSQFVQGNTPLKLRTLFPGKLWSQGWKTTTNKVNHLEFVSTDGKRKFVAKDAKSYFEFTLSWPADLGEDFVPGGLGLNPKKTGTNYSLTVWVDPDDADDISKTLRQIILKLNRKPQKEK